MYIHIHMWTHWHTYTYTAFEAEGCLGKHLVPQGQGAREPEEAHLLRRSWLDPSSLVT